jgi:hypothetical protein
MKEKNLQKFLPFVLVLTPFLVLALVAGIIYAPYLWTAKPTIDFVYTQRGYSCAEFEFYVQNNVINKRKTNISKENCLEPQNPPLYYHDVSQNRSREITFEEAKSLKLDNSSKSGEGFVLKQKSSYAGFLFSSSYNEGLYLIKDNVSFQQDLYPGYYGYYSYDGYQSPFLGWVIK